MKVGEWIGIIRWSPWESLSKVESIKKKSRVEAENQGQA